MTDDGLAREAARIEEMFLTRDAACRAVPEAVCDPLLAGMHNTARAGARDGFLLAAMRLFAAAGNGHSRVIPNPAIRVNPARIVLRDDRFCMVQGGVAVPVQRIGGRAVEDLVPEWADLLAGSSMRRRMLSGIMMVWPAALAVAGVTEADYALEDGARVRFGPADLVPALPLYPVSDTGALAAGEDPFPGPDAALVDGVWRVRLSDMKAITRARTGAVAEQISARPAPAIVDLRGNPGGDFTKALPLIDVLSRGPRCAVLVDAYTFSAAIVVAVLIAHRLGPRAALFGGDMGDDLRFWAEGDMETLPVTGAALRYATAWHDWRDGQADATTPATIAQHLVAAGDVPVRQTPMSEIDAAALAFVHGW